MRPRPLAWSLAALPLPQREAPPLWETPRRFRSATDLAAPPANGSAGCGLDRIAWSLAALSLPQREAPPLWETPRAATGVRTRPPWRAAYGALGGGVRRFVACSKE